MDEESSKIIDPLGEQIKLFIMRDSIPLTSQNLKIYDFNLYNLIQLDNLIKSYFKLIMLKDYNM